MLKVERLGVLLAPEKERFAKFNAGMIRVGDKVHMLYRSAESFDGESATGFRYKENFVAHAELDLNGKLIKDDKAPVIAPCGQFDTAGIEDPRIVEFEGVFYIFYTCFDLKLARVGVSKTLDFISYERIGVIPTNKYDKDAFMFPERIGGKIAYIHRIESTIQIDYFDRIDDLFNPAYWSAYDVSKTEVITGKYDWEDVKVGGSVPPVKTEDGWLFIYHGVGSDKNPFCYRAGAALLDPENPSKVIARLPYPILEPTEDYELNGDINNVVFPQGVFLNGDDMYMSYGGADTVVAIAKMSLKELLSELKKYPAE